MATPKKSALRSVETDDLPKRGVSYTRYSTEEQGSTPEQQGINEELAAENEITLAQSFHDEGLSRSLSERPGLLDVFDYLETHPDVRYLIVNELERLTAGIGQRQQITSLCKRLGITIVTEDIGMIDPHDEEKMHEADQRSVASQGELLKIRRRTRRSLRSRVRAGRSVIMRPPYGVRMVPLVTPEGVQLPSGVAMVDGSGKRINSGKIELHPDEYPHLVNMFTWSAEGESLGAIARRLNASGVPTKSGKGQWSSATLYGILNNTFYKGEMTWGLQETRRDEHGKKYTVVRSKGDPGRIDQESPLGAIIDPAVWDLAKAKREASSPSPGVPQPKQVLDGRVYCLRCGHKMYGRNNAGARFRKEGIIKWSYVCHSMRPAYKERPGFTNCTRSHTMSLQAILEALGDFNIRSAQIEVMRGASSDGAREAKRREHERIAKARAGIERAEDLALDGDISKEKLREKKAAFLATIEDAEARIAQLGSPRDVVIQPLADANLDGLADLVALLADDGLPLSRRIAALDKFGLEKIYVDKPFLRLDVRD